MLERSRFANLHDPGVVFAILLFKCRLSEPAGRFEGIFGGKHDAAPMHPHRAARADVANAQWNLDQTTYFAPANGVVVAITLRPGAMAVPLPMVPAMNFIEDEQWILAIYHQNEVRKIKPGQEAEVSFKMYPGRIVNLVNANSAADGDIVLNADDTASSAANRFAVGNDVTLEPGDAIIMGTPAGVGQARTQHPLVAGLGAFGCPFHGGGVILGDLFAEHALPGMRFRQDHADAHDIGVIDFSKWSNRFQFNSKARGSFALAFGMGVSDTTNWRSTMPTTTEGRCWCSGASAAGNPSMLRPTSGWSGA